MYQSILRTTLSSQRNQVRQIKWLVSIWGEKSSLMGCKFFFAVKTFVKSKDILYLLATCWLLPSWCLFFWIMWMFNWSVILNVLVIMNYFGEWLTDENVISLMSRLELFRKFKRHEQDLNLSRTCIFTSLNGAVSYR